ncbi:hypothetical protein AB0903_18270 [Streptomyces sp. NPDC048389]|uniref:hypothetical protein n=1 Tax=Streptomyces sp. NPDC048389 TaxID=3154622 RepID=UPI003453063F
MAVVALGGRSCGGDRSERCRQHARRGGGPDETARTRGSEGHRGAPVRSTTPEAERTRPQGTLRSKDGRAYPVQFTTAPLDSHRAALAALGARIGAYIPDATYVVRMNVATRGQVAALPLLRWVGRYDADDKIEGGAVPSSTRRYQGQSETYTLTTDGSERLKATMVYTDPMGLPPAAQARVNDLTLKLTAPDGTIYWGNNGLAAGNWSAPGGSANTIDTVENVFIQNPDAGTWTIDVIASQVNADGHVETPAPDVDFALVTTGKVTS